jgi:hypothetical protein
MPIATIEVGGRVRDTKKRRSWRRCIRSWVERVGHESHWQVAS